MAIKKMQQRRGTAAQWTAANPVLGNGEFGYETDSKRLKVGDGSTAWASLQYLPTMAAVTALVNGVIDAAPGALDTLKELATALGNDPAFATTVTNAIAAKYTKPGTGIPSSDMTSAVQALLTLAGTAVQPSGITGKLDKPTGFPNSAKLIGGDGTLVDPPTSSAAGWPLASDYYTPVGKTDGAISTLDTGGAVTSFGNSTGSVSSGVLTHPTAPANNSAWYIQRDLGTRVRRMGCEVKWTPNALGQLVFVLPSSAWTAPGGTLSASVAGLHLGIYGNGIWQAQRYNNPGVTTYAQYTTQGRFPTIWDSAWHSIEVWIDPDTSSGVLFVDNWTSGVFTDAAIGADTGNFAVWELFENTAGDVPAQLRNIWADGTPRRLNAVGATKWDVKRAIDTRQPKVLTGTVATAIGTAAKTVTLDGDGANLNGANALVAGDELALTYTNGTSPSAVTISVNGGPAYNVRLGNANANASHHYCASGGVLRYRFDGTYLHLLGSQANTAFDLGATSSTIAQRDANANLAIKAILQSANAITALIGTPSNLLVNSNPRVIITGSGGHIVNAPTTSIVSAYQFSVTNNQTSGTVTVNASNGSLIATLAVGQTIELQALQNTPTTPAHWKQIGGTYGAGGGSGITSSTGTFASRPGSGTTAGDLYYCTDTDAVYRWNGSAWVRIRFGAQGTTQGEPPSSGWTANNLGTSTVAQDKDSRLFTVPSQAAGARTEWRNPGSMTGAYTFTTQVDFTAYPTANFNTGIFLRNSTSGNQVFYGLGWDGTYNSITLMALTYNANAWNSTLISWGPHLLVRGYPSWIRIRDDGTNRYFEWSYNGVDWNTQLTHARTTHITADQIGWGADNTSGVTIKARLRSLDFA